MKLLKLHRRCLNQYDIARECGISQGMVSNYLKEARERFKVEQGDEYRALVTERVEQLKEVITEAWVEWERSKRDTVKIVQESGRKKAEEKPKRKKGKAPNARDPNPEDRREELVLLRQTRTVEGRLGDVRYLSLIRECYRDISQLEGLVDGRGSDTPAGGFDWEKFLNAPREPTVEERADETVRRAIAARGEDGTADGPVIDGTLADGERQQQEVG